MLQLPQIPNKIIPLTIERYNSAFPKRKISERSYKQYLRLRDANAIVTPIVVVGIVIGAICWSISSSLTEGRFEDGKIALSIIMAIITGGAAALVCVATALLFPLILIDEFIHEKITPKILQNKYPNEKKYNELTIKIDKVIYERTQCIKEIAIKLGVEPESLDKIYTQASILSIPPEFDCYCAYRKWIESYELYLRNREKRENKEYWYNLGDNGREFEKEIQKLFIRKGYSARLTPQSNDGGVDIILNKNGIITYVQCKQYAQKIGIQVARELYGVMCANKVSKGIIATIHGANDNTLTFCKQNNIEVLTVLDYISPIVISQPVNENEYKEAYYKKQHYRHNEVWISDRQFISKQEASRYCRNITAPYKAIIELKRYTLFGVIYSYSQNILKDMLNSNECGVIEII